MNWNVERSVQRTFGLTAFLSLVLGMSALQAQDPKAASKAAKAEAAAAAARKAAHELERKKERDARYAARKARKK